MKHGGYKNIGNDPNLYSQSTSQFLVSAQRSFATKTPHPPPWQDGNLLRGYSQQYVTRTQSYTWVKRDKVKQFSCLRKQPEDKIFNPQIYLYRVQI